MSWLTPLGFLGLIGIIILIIIYIIKPNYQNKIISSTFVWKLSLKYRKKKIPLSKLRNILLFICQLLIIASMASILAQPYIEGEEPDEYTEKVVIIDASASMMTNVNGETRFERAVEMVRDLADEVIANETKLTLILAHDTASYLLQQNANKDDIYDTLDALIDPAEGNVCTFGTADIEGAIKLAEEITATTPDTDVYLYSDTSYIDAGDVKVVPVSDPAEYNASILDVRAIVDENYYRIEIDVACYGINSPIGVFCDVYGVNAEGSTLSFMTDVLCEYDTTKTLIYALQLDENSAADPNIVFGDTADIYSFENIHVYIQEDDSFEYDNSFYLYGGEKLPLRIQYYSALPNSYFGTALLVLRDQLSYRWNIDYEEVKRDEIPETEGFDIYIYEHKMPSTIPNDGIVLLVNPDTAPAGAGFILGSTYGSSQEVPLSTDSDGAAHPILNMINPENITVTEFTQILTHDGFDTLLYCQESPIMIAKNDPYQKIAVMSFSLNYSNLPLLLEFPLMMYNMIEYFSPSTVTEYVFDINEEISLNARGDSLDVSGPGVNTTIEEFPGKITLTQPGVYTLSQTPISGDSVVETFYVKLPAEESDIYYEVDTLVNPFFIERPEVEDLDLLLYFAIALVALLFVEWWLHSREQF